MSDGKLILTTAVNPEIMGSTVIAEEDTNWHYVSWNFTHIIGFKNYQNALQSTRYGDLIKQAMKEYPIISNHYEESCCFFMLCPQRPKNSNLQPIPEHKLIFPASGFVLRLLSLQTLQHIVSQENEGKKRALSDKFQKSGIT